MYSKLDDRYCLGQDLEKSSYIAHGKRNTRSNRNRDPFPIEFCFLLHYILPTLTARTAYMESIVGNPGGKRFDAVCVYFKKNLLFATCQNLRNGSNRTVNRLPNAAKVGAQTAQDPHPMLKGQKFFILRS